MLSICLLSIHVSFVRFWFKSPVLFLRSFVLITVRRPSSYILDICTIRCVPGCHFLPILGRSINCLPPQNKSLPNLAIKMIHIYYHTQFLWIVCQMQLCCNGVGESQFGVSLESAGFQMALLLPKDQSSFHVSTYPLLAIGRRLPVLLGDPT